MHEIVTPALSKSAISGSERGFTLIELSIVLVIIGLIVGGVLVGQNLIASATVRAQITQIEKFNAAVNTFRDKYGGLPGDLQLSLATQYGFDTNLCDGSQGKRDGNGLIEGYSSPNVLLQGTDETAQFWQDLNTSGLVNDSLFNPGSISVGGGCAVIATPTISTTIGNFLPTAKIGNQNYIYVYSLNGSNWYGISAATGFNTTGRLFSTPGMSVITAYNIDKKIDDGLPATGNTIAAYINNSVASTTTPVNASADSATTCYNTASTPAYSISYNNGAGVNCALSFRFQ